MNALIFALIFSSVSPSYEYREPPIKPKAYVVAPSTFILVPDFTPQEQPYHPWYLPDYMRERPEPKYKRIPWK